MEFSPGHKSPWSAIDSSLCQMEVKRNTKCTALLLLALPVFNISQGLPCLAPTIAITHRRCWILQTCLPSAGCGSFGRPLAQWRFPCPHLIVPSTHPTSTCNNQFVEKCCDLTIRRVAQCPGLPSVVCRSTVYQFRPLPVG